MIGYWNFHVIVRLLVRISYVNCLCLVILLVFSHHSLASFYTTPVIHFDKYYQFKIFRPHLFDFLANNIYLHLYLFLWQVVDSTHSVSYECFMLRTKVAVQSCDTTQTIRALRTLDSVCIWFWINFWLLLILNHFAVANGFCHPRNQSTSHGVPTAVWEIVVYDTLFKGIHYFSQSLVRLLFQSLLSLNGI